MQRTQLSNRYAIPRSPIGPAGSARRGGAVIILSLAMLLTLLFLGLFFFAFIDDESTSADFFAKTFTTEDPPFLDTSEIMNFGLRQVIVGTNGDDEDLSYYAPYSALYGSRYSMLAHILGQIRDDGSPVRFEPYSGTGMRIYDDGGTFRIDVDADGSSDGTLSDLRLHRGRLTNNTGLTSPDFSPNAGYTYPDINALFLSHESVSSGQIAIKPSFDLPGVLYADAGSGEIGPSAARVLRPHSEHQYSSGVRRYLNAATMAQSGDTSRVLQPFDFFQDAPTNYGIWRGAPDYSDLSIDADNDGRKDSFLIDLGYPLVTFPDGSQGVPLHYWKILDADGLINLNTSGDMPMQRLHFAAGSSRSDVLDNLLSQNLWMTGANFGWSPSEINPGVALAADPDDSTYLDGTITPTAIEQHQSYYDEQAGTSPTTFNRRQLANTELLWLMSGRKQYASDGSPLPTDFFGIPGRYGEAATTLEPSSAAFAAAGTTNHDDDRDSNSPPSGPPTLPVGRQAGGYPYLEQFWDRSGNPLVTPGVQVPPVVHPLDVTGFGRSLSLLSGYGMTPIHQNSSLLDPQLPGRWLAYDATNVPGIGEESMWQFQGDFGAAGVRPMSHPSAFKPALQNYIQRNPAAATGDFLTDEPDELLLDGSSPNINDNPFGATEVGGLHISNADWTLLGATSRIRQLAPANFQFNYRAQEIRRRFTTVSWDRPEFSFARDNYRTWERDSDGVFPPSFGGTANSPNDPFRTEVRRLMTVDYGADEANTNPQHRLQLNGILSDDETAGGAACFDTNGNPRFRPLVPHPTFTAGDPEVTPSAMVHTNAPAYQFSEIGTDKAAQEWWARYDRQRLARDLYVLLWTVGRIDNTTPVTGAQAREMAQFAVNAVDAMDRDNVITRFEYDPNPGDGWSTSTGDLEVVYGVEAQSLTFSEALWIRSQTSGDEDHPATMWDDTLADGSGNKDFHFLFVELRNVLPNDIRFDRNDTWRLGLDSDNDGIPNRYVTIQQGTQDVIIGPGENFLIGGHDGKFKAEGGSDDGKPQAAVFRLDYLASGPTEPPAVTYHPLVPYLSEADTPTGDVTTAKQAFPDPLCDLDLCHEDHDNRFVEGAGGSSPQPVGNFLTGLGPSAMTISLVLERRPNLQGVGSLNQGSDWVEVDRVRVNVQAFDITNNTDMTQIQTKFRNLNSSERREPFFVHAGGDGLATYTGGNGFFKHTLGGPDIEDGNTDPSAQAPADSSLKHQRNSRLPSGTRYRLWQPHFDRGFTSVYDLLSVLAIGPDQLIYHDQDDEEPGMIEVDSVLMKGIHAAAVRFLHPEATLPSHLSVVGDEHYANRWYRLFEFLSVPSHTGDEIADQLQLRRRIPGRVNLNTVRDEHSFAAVVNDKDQLDLYDNNNPSQDQLEGSRNWYQQMLLSRDGDSGGGSPYPPGTPFARPFRPLTFDDQVPDPDTMEAAPLASTILRQHAGTDFPELGLFEARTSTDVNDNRIDWYTRHRILSRIANLTTNRSHVFIVFGGYQFHEAHETGDGEVQIGAKMDSVLAHRELLVVDMSRLEEAYGDWDNDPDTRNTFNFETFIIHREVLP